MQVGWFVFHGSATKSIDDVRTECRLVILYLMAPPPAAATTSGRECRLVILYFTALPPRASATSEQRVQVGYFVFDASATKSIDDVGSVCFPLYIVVLYFTAPPPGASTTSGRDCRLVILYSMAPPPGTSTTSEQRMQVGYFVLHGSATRSIDNVRQRVQVGYFVFHGSATRNIDDVRTESAGWLFCILWLRHQEHRRRQNRECRLVILYSMAPPPGTSTTSGSECRLVILYFMAPPPGVSTTSEQRMQVGYFVFHGSATRNIDDVRTENAGWLFCIPWLRHQEYRRRHGQSAGRLVLLGTWLFCISRLRHQEPRRHQAESAGCLSFTPPSPRALTTSEQRVQVGCFVFHASVTKSLDDVRTENTGWFCISTPPPPRASTTSGSECRSVRFPWHMVVLYFTVVLFSSSSFLLSLLH